jgi:ribonuclease BN (tRNA processing enzyme)
MPIYVLNMQTDYKPHPQTVYDIYKKNTIEHFGISGIVSIAARHTALKYGSVQLDCGYVPRESWNEISLVLITHFHADHGADVENCINTTSGRTTTIFCPSYSALLLFNKIKCSISMQKGRMYEDLEIVKIVRIIGCKRDNDPMKDQKQIASDADSSLTIVELVNMGQFVRVGLPDRDVVIEPFQCYHTVDTCGYVVHEIERYQPDVITIDKDFTIDINFTEDQTFVRKKKKELKEQTDRTVEISGDLDDWKDCPKFDHIVRFNQRHGTNIYPTIIDRPMNPKFTLKVRRLHIPDGLNIRTKDQHNKQVLTDDDYDFFNTYKIDINHEHVFPKIMFFGDTCSYVFHKKNTRIHELLNVVKLVIIESTYLENPQQLDPQKLKKRQENRHMFLSELMPIFKNNPKTQFLLIHFSARYSKSTIMRSVDQCKKMYGNVTAFL